MDAERVQAVLGHVLAVAAEHDDYRDREMGPIHLLKYLFLADLAYAATHDGESFTGLLWRFHKFGPWAVEAYQQLEPSMAVLGAARRELTSPYRDDYVRWSFSGGRLETRTSRLPLEVSGPVGQAVRTFGSDTSALLHHVYRTAPMLRAAPGDRLDLRPEPAAASVPPPERLPEIKLSKTRLRKLREEVQRRLREKRRGRRTSAPQPPPVYDEVFAAGVAWLDGPELEPRTGTLSFSDDVWASPARGETELS